jgi:hypothetical protein
MIRKYLGPLLATATAPLVINAGASRAILFIDLVEVSPTRTEIRTSGSLNLTGLSSTNLNITTGAPAQTGLNTNTDVIRFIQGASFAGRYYSFTGPANPFTADNINQPNGSTNCSGTGNCLAIATPAPSVAVPFIFNRSSALVQNIPASTIWLANSYTSGNSIVNSFFLDRSLAQIGLASPTVTYTLAGSTETIVFREQVPGPLPILGAATAFSFSRRLRARILKASEAEAEQSQQA